MANINMHLGFTFPFGETARQFAKVDVEINDIDVEMPLEPQLENVDNALGEVWKFLRQRVDAQIDELLQKD